MSTGKQPWYFTVLCSPPPTGAKKNVNYLPFNISQQSRRLKYLFYMKFTSRTILDQWNKIQNNCLLVLKIFTLHESWKKSRLKQTFNGIWAEIPVTVEGIHRVSYFLPQNTLTSTVTEHRTGEQHVYLEHSLCWLRCWNYITQLNYYRYKTLPWRVTPVTH